MKLKKLMHVLAVLVCTALAISTVALASLPAEGTDAPALNHDFSLGFPDTPYYVTDGTTEEVYNDFRASLPEEMELFDPYVVEGKHEIFIAVNGSDKNPGTIDKPVKTLQAAVDRLAALPNRVGGAVIYFRGGTYPIEETVVIPSTLSGNEQHPLFISSYGDEEVKLYAAKTKTAKPQPVTDDPVALKKFDSSVIDKILKIDCSDLNISYVPDKTAEIKAVIDGIDYNMARWPNYGYTNFAKYTGADGENGVITTGDIRSGTDSTDTFVKPFEFAMTTYRPTTWENTGNIWIYGRMNKEYYWERHNVDSFNPQIPSLKSKTPAHEGCKYNGNYNIYYFYNVMEELDNHGEYFYDTDTNTLYFYPTEDVSDKELTVLIPNTLDIMISVSSARNVVFNGIEFGYGASTAIEIKSDMNVIQNCTFRNMQDYAVLVYGKNNGVIYSKFLNNNNIIQLNPTYNDDKSARISTSATRTEPTRNFFQNNYVQSVYGGNHYLYSANNIQTVISHNTFNSDSGMSFHGANRHNVIENNRLVAFRSVVKDGGAIYNSGSFIATNSTYRGNYFRRYVNEDYPNATHGLYFDDLSCTGMIYNNIFVDCDLYYHGGSNHTADNNIFIGIDKQSETAFRTSINYWVTTGGMSDAAENNFNRQPNTKGENKNWSVLNDTFSKWDYRLNDLFANYRAVRSERNSLGDAYVRNETEDYVRSQRNNVCINNIFYRRPGPVVLESDLNPDYRDNYVTRDDPGFVDAANYNFDLREDAAVFDAVQGFEPLPSMEDMGIVFGKGQFMEKFDAESAKCVAPSNSTEGFVQNTDLKLDWTDAFGASEYILKVSEKSDFSELLLDKSIPGVYSEYTFPELKYDTVYYWKVETKANDDSFKVRSAESDVFTFRTCKEKDAYLFEELNTDVLRNAVNDVRSNLEYITDDTGEDIGYGVYKQGTRKQLEELANAAEAKINTLKLQKEVDEAAQKLHEDYLDIISANAIPYTRYITNFDDTTWFATSENVKVKFASDKKSVSLTPDKGTSSLLMHRPLSPKEAVSFKMKFETLGTGWPTLNNRMLDRSVNSPYYSDGYFIALSGNNIELQKIKDGKTGDERIVQVVERGNKIPVNEWFDVYILTENTTEGVHIVFKVNDNVIIDYLDKDNFVRDLGYFGVKQDNGHPNYELGAAEVK